MFLHILGSSKLGATPRQGLWLSLPSFKSSIWLADCIVRPSCPFILLVFLAPIRRRRWVNSSRPTSEANCELKQARPQISSRFRNGVPATRFFLCNLLPETKDHGEMDTFPITFPFGFLPLKSKGCSQIGDQISKFNLRKSVTISHF
jgi:hypothetical protein